MKIKYIIRPVRPLFLFYFLLLLSVNSPKSYPSVGDTFGFGIRNIALGGAANYTDGGSFSAKGNPASLVTTGKPLLSIGYLNTNLNLEHPQNDRNPETTSGIVADTHTDVSSSKDLKNFTLGLAVPLNSFLFFGLAGSFPVTSLARVHTLTKNEIDYLNFSDRQLRPEIYTALGVTLPYGFSIGAGLFYSLKAEGITQVAISSTDAEARMLMEVKPDLIPYGGLLYQFKRAQDEILVGVMYRDEQSAESRIDVDVRFEITNLATIPFSTASALVAYYDPAIFGIGAAYKREKWHLYLSIQKNLWSRYKAPIINLSGTSLADLTGGALTQDDIALQDSWGYKVGFELPKLYSNKSILFSSRVGIEKHTSALPKNPSGLMIVDTDWTALNLGAGVDIRKWKRPFSLDLAFKWIHLSDKQFNVVENDIVTQTAMVGGKVYTLVGGVTFEF